MFAPRAFTTVCFTAVLVVLPSSAVARPPDPCGVTTLGGTVQDANGDGVLECGPPDELVVRTDLVRAGEDRSQGAEHLISFLLLADFQIGDEELTLPSRTNVRSYPAMIPHMLNAHLKAANAVAEQGGPVFGNGYDLAFALGDLTDNAQFNEMRLMIDLMDGGKLVDPNSGGPGLDGGGPDPKGAGDLRTPVRGERIVDLANEPFWAQGLRRADGSKIPWYAIQGNHDSKVAGMIPHHHHGWRESANEWATGHQRILRLNAQLEAELRDVRAHRQHLEHLFWMRVFDAARSDPASVGRVVTVDPDPDRRILSKEEWMRELANSTDAPHGHGFGAGADTCPDAYPDAYTRRACYAVDHGDVRFIALDDNAVDDVGAGSIDRAQLRWLEERLIDASTAYVDWNGERVSNPSGRDRYVVVLSHHTSKGMHNGKLGGPASDEARGDEVSRLLLRFPNVVMHANGHSHTNRVWSHRNRRNGTRYWEVNVASVADNPHNGRSIEFARNTDGTLSIFGVLFELGITPNPRQIDWTGDDPTDEVALGDARRTINEDWLAAAGAEQSLTEVARRRYGDPRDRNIELLLPDPWSPPVAATSGVALAEVRWLGVVIVLGGCATLFRRRRPRR